MAENVIADRAQVTFVKGWAKYGSNELMPPGLYVHAVFRCPTGGYAIRLEPGNPGIDPKPGLLPLQPWIKQPGDDEPVDQHVTDVAVLYVNHEARPDTVSIRGYGGTVLTVEPL